MEFYPALNCWKRFTDRRGAVLLLTVYFASLLLLVIGGISLQRTIVETGASQVSRDNQKAFFLAEGTLDFVMKQLAVKDLPDGSYPRDEVDTPEMLPGTEFTLTTSGAKIVDQNTQEITRTITATGTAARSSATITATVAAQGPIKGGWAKGPIRVLGAFLNGSDPDVLRGDLRSARGFAEVIKLQSYLNHEGQLQIAPSEPAPAGEDYHNSNLEDHPWIESLGSPSASEWMAEQPGVYLQTFLGHTPTSKLCAACQETKKPLIFTMPAPPTISPLPPGQCSESIVLGQNQNLTIIDGNANPPDLSPPNDGQIVLCLQYLENHEAHSKVIFNAPATVYLAGKNADGYAVRTYGLYTVPQNQNHLPPENADLTPSGLKLIVTKAPVGNVAGKVTLESRRFAGSVYAPESLVTFEMQWHGYDTIDYRLENIVAREIAIYTVGHTLSINNQPANAAAAKTTVTLRSWSAN